MKLNNYVWWAVFFVCGIWAQYFVPGVDFLIVGIMLALQEGRLPQTIWVIVVVILAQEGLGSLAFGSSLLWYAAAIGLFRLGRWLFQARNLVFMGLMGLALGLWHFMLTDMMASLQSFAVERDRLMFESLLQGLFFPVAWVVASELRPRGSSDALPL